MASACLMPALSRQPSTCVWPGGTAFALSTMGRSRGGARQRSRQEGEMAALAHVMPKRGARGCNLGEAEQGLPGLAASGPSDGRPCPTKFATSRALEPGANVERVNPPSATDHIRNCRVADCRTVHVESLNVHAHLLVAKGKVRQSDCKVPRVSILTENH